MYLMETGPEVYPYDVALSFAGKDREQCEELAELLISKGVSVFYDRHEQSDLWGKDLYQHLQKIYKDSARFCVVFVSRSYVGRPWPRHELKQAQARDFIANREYILPLRLDDAELPGLNPTIGYVDLRQTSIRSVTNLLFEKLYGAPFDDFDTPPNWRGELVEYRGATLASFWPEKIRTAQSFTHYVVERVLARIPYGAEAHDGGARARPCHDCGVLEGEFCTYRRATSKNARSAEGRPWAVTAS